MFFSLSFMSVLWGVMLCDLLGLNFGFRTLIHSFNCLSLLINLQLQLKMRSMSLTLQRLRRHICVLLSDRMLYCFYKVLPAR